MKIRCEYEAHGTAKQFYKTCGADYRNPQEHDIRRLLQQIYKDDAWEMSFENVLDLACGSGEISLMLQDLDDKSVVQGMDPYTWEAYEKRVGKPCERHSFEDIASGLVEGDNRCYSTIICCFALHLLDESWLPALLAQLQYWTKTLLILTPHKRPHFKPHWGWTLDNEMVKQRVRARLYHVT